MNKYKNFHLKISHNKKILNIDNILKYLDGLTIDEETLIFLKNLENYLCNSDYSNKDELLMPIRNCIIDYELERSFISNSEALKIMQGINTHFNDFNLVSSKNNENEYLDYLTYINKCGKIEVIMCGCKDILSKYLKNHIQELKSYSKNDIITSLFAYFRHFLKFQEIDVSKLVGNEKDEFKEIKRYAEKFNIPSRIEIATYKNGEVFYRLNDGLFKFSDDENHLMVSIITPKTMLL